MEFEKKMAMNIKKDPKTFYAYVRNKQKTRATVGPLKNEEGEVIHSNKEAVELLNSYFASVFTKEDMENLPNPKRFYEGREVEELTSIIIKEEVVLRKLSSLKDNKPPGPDSLYPKILKEACAELCVTLGKLFQRSLTEGEVTPVWRVANITCIHKKGSKSLPSNYRPVSLTSVACKVLESIIRDHIVSHLKKYNLIVTSQHGFTKGRSCLTNLLTFLKM